MTYWTKAIPSSAHRFVLYVWLTLIVDEEYFMIGHFCKFRWSQVSDWGNQTLQVKTRSSTCICDCVAHPQMPTTSFCIAEEVICTRFKLTMLHVQRSQEAEIWS